MPAPLIFTGPKSANGRSIKPDDPELVAAYIGAFPDKQIFTVKIEPYKKPRSRGRPNEEGNQLGFFFGQLVPIWMKEIDFTIHKYESYYNIMNLLSFEMVTAPNGKPRKKLIHVDDNMTSEQMTRLIENCQIYAAQEHGVFIPDPDATKSKRWRARFMVEYL